MAANQAQVYAAIASGIAFQWLDSVARLGLSDAATDAGLQRRLGGPSRIDLDTVYEIVVAYQLWRQAGEAIQRQTNPDTPYVRHLPTLPGCSGPYEYIVVVPFTNPVEDKDRTRAFPVISDKPLSYNQIQQQAAIAAATWADLGDTGPAAAGDEGQWQQSGMGIVTAAAKCAP